MSIGTLQDTVVGMPIYIIKSNLYLRNITNIFVTYRKKEV
jgi:hypothetical protein